MIDPVHVIFTLFGIAVAAVIAIYIFQEKLGISRKTVARSQGKPICPYCDSPLNPKLKSLGQKVTCPECSSEIQMPSPLDAIINLNGLQGVLYVISGLLFLWLAFSLF